MTGKANKRKVDYGALLAHFSKDLSGVVSFGDMCELLVRAETSWAETRDAGASKNDKKKANKTFDKNIMLGNVILVT